MDTLRSQYSMAINSLPSPADRQGLTAFFFWSSWAATTDRPGETDVSYTSNWPQVRLDPSGARSTRTGRAASGRCVASMARGLHFLIYNQSSQG